MNYHFLECNFVELKVTGFYTEVFTGTYMTF
jgi:hypothetical protein